MKRRRWDRGFTLVEMLAVVIIVGVLATLAVFGVSKYVRAAKTSEAMSMIAAIKTAQESFRDETFRYLDVSQGDYTQLYPMSDPGKMKVQWGGGSGTVPNNWRTLGVVSDGPVYFGYASIATAAGTAPIEPPTGKTFNFPATNEPQYVVIAVGDLDGDDVNQVVVSHSYSAEIYVEREGE